MRIAPSRRITSPFSISTAFAMATAYSYTFSLRHPDSPWRYPVWIGTYALAGLTGIAGAGAHVFAALNTAGMEDGMVLLAERKAGHGQAMSQTPTKRVRWTWARYLSSSNSL